MHAFVRLCASLLFLTFAFSAGAADKAIIILDASGSMWAQVDGEAKIDIARKTLRTVLQTVPPGLELGLMAYGHRDKGSCSDIELIVPPAADSAEAIVSAADALVPKGKTPISEAVKQAAEALRYTEDKATVILITDGLETCEADPCAVASALEQSGVDFTVHVVGFGLSDEEGKKVACLAENTGGKYFSAANAANLGKALTETVAEVVAPPPPPPPPPPPQPAPAEVAKPDNNLAVTAKPSPDGAFAAADGLRYDVYRATPDGHESEGTTQYGDGGVAEPFNLPAGRYVVRASKDLVAAEQTVEVSEDKTTEIEINLDAGFIAARAMATETVPVPADARFDVTDGSGKTDTGYGLDRRVLVNAGAATVAVELGAAKASVPVTVAAGQTYEVDVVLGAGRLTVHGKRSAEATDYDDGIRWDVSGNGIETQTKYGGEETFDLPAGAYQVKATLGNAIAELDATIPGGDTVDKVVVVATGKIVAHALFAEGGPTATEGTRFDVLGAVKDSNGKYPDIQTSYGDGAEFNLPPGKYILRASADSATAEAGIEVVAGPPQEIAVVLNAGLLALTAPGGDRLDVLGTKKDIYGKQASIATTYGEEWQITLPVGDYLIKVHKKDGSDVTANASIKPGERTELSVQ